MRFAIYIFLQMAIVSAAAIAVYWRYGPTASVDDNGGQVFFLGAVMLGVFLLSFLVSLVMARSSRS